MFSALLLSLATPLFAAQLPFSLSSSSSLANSTFHNTFHPLPDTLSFLSALQHNFSSLLSLEHAGYTAQGRAITAAVLSSPHKQKPRFLILAAQHAREWIATSTALYLIHALVDNTTLLDTFDFYIIPVANPDGYLYTWDQDRFWYKNVMPIGDELCKGIDMNRSGYAWTPPTPTSSPCAPWYPGTRPFQAPEVASLATYIRGIQRLEGFVDLRSYGQMLSIPYSHTCDTVPKDAEDLLEGALGAAAALRSVHGTVMTTGMLCQTLYRAPGNVLDWVYVDRGVKYSFALHLRDTGTYGFTLPPEWIRPVGEETAEMVAYLVGFIDSEKDRKGSP